MRAFEPGTYSIARRDMGGGRELVEPVESCRRQLLGRLGPAVADRPELRRCNVLLEAIAIMRDDSAGSELYGASILLIEVDREKRTRRSQCRHRPSTQSLPQRCYHDDECFDKGPLAPPVAPTICRALECIGIPWLKIWLSGSRCKSR